MGAPDKKNLTPFTFGKIAIDKNFTNRQSEIEKLETNFSSLINTVLISPRRWGKSSLVAKAAKTAAKKDKNLRICFLDLHNIRSENEFYQLLAQEVLKATSSKVKELMDLAKSYLGQLLPKISFSPGADLEFSLSFNRQEVQNKPDDILNLAENIAKSKNIKFIICIDEFQNIASFDNPLAIQKKLRSHWQKHNHTAYCIYGSKRHMLMDVFTSPSMPFYKFGDLIFLQKIKQDDWIPFIQKRFTDTGKKIDKTDVELMTNLTECHPYYVQQLAQQSWLRTKVKCNTEIVLTSNEHIIMQLSLLFQNMTDHLSATQINFLKAVTDNVEQLSSKETLDKYNLGTSGNVAKIKSALINKEIIDISGKEVILLDPMYKQWLEKDYFGKSR